MGTAGRLLMLLALDPLQNHRKTWREVGTNSHKVVSCSLHQQRRLQIPTKWCHVLFINKEGCKFLQSGVMFSLSTKQSHMGAHLALVKVSDSPVQLSPQLPELPPLPVQLSLVRL